MKTFMEVLEYGEEKTLNLSGKLLKGFARAVDAGKPAANAEILLMSDDSAGDSEVRLIYCENGGMSEYVFLEMNRYIHNSENLIDIFPFSYVREGVTKTGVVIATKVARTITELSKAFK